MTEPVYTASWRRSHALYVVVIGATVTAQQVGRLGDGSAFETAYAAFVLVIVWSALLTMLVTSVAVTRDEVVIRTLLRTTRVLLDDLRFTPFGRWDGTLWQRGTVQVWSVPWSRERRRFFAVLDELRGSSRGTT